MKALLESRFAWLAWLPDTGYARSPRRAIRSSVSFDEELTCAHLLYGRRAICFFRFERSQVAVVMAVEVSFAATVGLIGSVQG